VEPVLASDESSMYQNDIPSISRLVLLYRSLVPRSSHCQGFDSFTVCKTLGSLFYVVNDFSMYLGRKKGRRPLTTEQAWCLFLKCLSKHWNPKPS